MYVCTSVHIYIHIPDMLHCDFQCAGIFYLQNWWIFGADVG